MTRGRPGAPTARPASAGPTGSPTTHRPTTFFEELHVPVLHDRSRNQPEPGGDLRPSPGRAGRACTVARDDQPRRRNRRLAQHRPHADRRRAVRADEGHALNRFRCPSGRQLQILLAVGVERAHRRLPRPALGALSRVLASVVQRSECRAQRRWFLLESMNYFENARPPIARDSGRRERSGHPAESTSASQVRRTMRFATSSTAVPMSSGRHSR